MTETHASESVSVRLRAMEPQDVDMLYALENDTLLWQYGDSTTPYSRAALAAFVTDNANDIYRDCQLRLVIEASGEAAGCADLFRFDPINRRAEVGIALLPAWRGRGIGGVALRQLTVFAREHLALHQLYAVVSEANVPGLRLFASCRFDSTARLHSWLLRGAEPRDAIVFQLILDNI